MTYRSNLGFQKDITYLMFIFLNKQETEAMETLDYQTKDIWELKIISNVCINYYHYQKIRNEKVRLARYSAFFLIQFLSRRMVMQNDDDMTIYQYWENLIILFVCLFVYLEHRIITQSTLSCHLCIDNCSGIKTQDRPWEPDFHWGPFAI